MKTAERIYKEERKKWFLDKPPYSLGMLASSFHIEAMHIYGRQCFEAGRETKMDPDFDPALSDEMDMFISKYDNYEQCKNELK